MLFGSLEFFLFFLVVMALTWAAASNTARKAILLAASYCFYAYWDYRFLTLVVFVSVCAWGSSRYYALGHASNHRRLVCFVAVALQLAVLGFFKYFNFFTGSFAVAAGALGVHLDSPTLAIILPIGLSFYVFHSISFTVDSYDGKLDGSRFSFVDVALYIAFFPQLIAGPIMRGRDFLPQLESRPQWSGDRAAEAVRLFVLGFCYKYILADNLALLADPVFAAPEQWSAGGLWGGALSYSAQIYFDFAGYSWMAIGCAGLLGYRLPPNFDFPYIARSTTEFWRRWHMSLSSWLRDYLFIPLGGSRRGRPRYYANLFITMGLGGLWHGASWNFALWGTLHGIGLCVHKLVTGERPPSTGSRSLLFVQAAAALLITQLWVTTLWVFFRAPSLAGASTMLSGMFGVRSTHAAASSLPIWVCFAVVGLVAIDALAGRVLIARRPAHRIPPLIFGVLLGLAIEIVLFASVMANKPFVYFQF